MLESISLDGSDRRLLLSNVGHGYGVAVFEGMVYWSDWSQRSVWRASIGSGNVSSEGLADRTGESFRRLVVDGLTGLMDLHAAMTTRSQHSHRQ